MFCTDELRRTAEHLRLVAKLEKDPVKVRELRYLAAMYDEELREAEETGRRCAPGSVPLLPSL